MEFKKHIIFFSFFTLLYSSLNLSEDYFDLAENNFNYPEIKSESLAITSSYCPDDMVEISGNYCTNLDQKCLQWRDSESKKVCLKFQENYAKCIGTEVYMHFCVDKYEIPNIKGNKPKLGMSFYDVDKFCKSVNKRMGTDQEWTLAAEGNERSPYPQRWEREPMLCNWDKNYITPDWNALLQGGASREKEMLKLDQSDPSGSHVNCVSSFGAYDMQGNADEWTVNVSQNGKPYIGLLKGGYWGYGQVRNRARPSTDGHGPEFNGYEVSGRCFKDIK